MEGGQLVFWVNGESRPHQLPLSLLESCNLAGREADCRGWEPAAPLLAWLRLQPGLAGTKSNCTAGCTGACTVLLSVWRPAVGEVTFQQLQTVAGLNPKNPRCLTV